MVCRKALPGMWWSTRLRPEDRADLRHGYMVMVMGVGVGVGVGC